MTPPGERDIPVCPDCGASGARCVRPSGHEAASWHVAREDAMALACGCEEVCVPWLRKRGKWPEGHPAPGTGRLDELGGQLELAMAAVDAAAAPLFDGMGLR